MINCVGDLFVNWMLLIYFMLASQPAEHATMVPMTSQAICLKEAFNVKQRFATYWARKRLNNVVAGWERSKKRAGQAVPNGKDLEMLMSKQNFKKIFEKKFGVGSSAKYIGPFPPPEAEDFRLAENTIFTVCVPSR